MKKMMFAMLVCVMAAGAAYAVTEPSEDDYRSLDELRSKLVRMRREMDRFMKDIVGDYPGAGPSMQMQAFGQEIKVDVSENDKYITVRADLPGMDKDKLEVTLDNNRILKIAGSREMYVKEEKPNLIKQERMSGRFERVLELPAECLSEGIKAAYKNGVLDIVIPKKEQGKKEAVKISVQ